MTLCKIMKDIFLNTETSFDTIMDVYLYYEEICEKEATVCEDIPTFTSYIDSIHDKLPKGFPENFIIFKEEVFDEDGDEEYLFE